ncbi:MAG: hypothetical protein CMJ72_12320 [Planctomycetaceae bacterium]|nr:hypothetical protein [Planctomycetaceae bacterium]MCH2595100.1 hypothetical protein [Pirellulales bacterium]HCK41220.1 hypothetical protein [Planctomycetaceae bacterium]|tara:strand:+ start:337 stop:1002 length:666 start_codon:yes stop_codon:yes gene_type:complete
MDHSFNNIRLTLKGILLAGILISTSGCLHSLLATGVYLWQGGNVVPAETETLQNERVVVVCRPPATNEYRYAGAARSIGKQVSRLLAENVPGIDVVSPAEVDNWVDEQDWDNFKDLGRSLKATRVVYIELSNYDLYKGATLYQGDAEVQLTVYDMNNRGKEIWERNVGQILFPHNSGIPAADKSVQQFQSQFVVIVSGQIARHFYRHNPNSTFALDAVANK